MFVIGKEVLDLDQDPPPDLVVEINRTSSSLNRFEIYAGLCVPEIWRIIGHRVELHLLDDDSYRPSPGSLAFPFLTAQVLSEFLAQGINEGERRVARAFRWWVREHNQRASWTASIAWTAPPS